MVLRAKEDIEQCVMLFETCNRDFRVFLVLSLFCLSSAKVVLYIAAASLLDQTVFSTYIAT